MFIEIHVASNFIASLLYNRLPRRRVNIFGEELEKALKDKFVGHWYPEMPEKGSGFRCIKVGRRIFNAPDAILNQAAVESGTPINEILEHLPEELTLWIDPGEVSYKIGDRKPVKVLYSGAHQNGMDGNTTANNNNNNNGHNHNNGGNDPHHHHSSGGNNVAVVSSNSSEDGDVATVSTGKLLMVSTDANPTFSSSSSDFEESSNVSSSNNNNNSSNSITSRIGAYNSFKTLSVSDCSLLSTVVPTTSAAINAVSSPVINSKLGGGLGPNLSSFRNGTTNAVTAAAAAAAVVGGTKIMGFSPTSAAAGVGGGATNGVGVVQPMNFVTRCNTPTFTTASFAQTKFGSTKLKTNTKRTNRMSPTEFSNYIKQRAQMQQHQMNRNHPLSPMMSPRPMSPQMRSFVGENYFFPNSNGGGANSPIGGFRDCDIAAGLFDSNLANITVSDAGPFAANKYSFLDDGTASSFFNQSSSSLADSLSPIGTPPTAGLSPVGNDVSAGSKHVFQPQELDFLENLNLAANNSAANSYTNPYQHLLLAN